MSPVRHFTDLKVWQAAHRLFIDIAADVDAFPKTAAARAISDQILRSTGSVGANIAEGFNAPTKKEYLRYLDIARRSTNETEHWLHSAAALGFIAREAAGQRLATCEEVRRMLHGLRNSLKAKAKP